MLAGEEWTAGVISLEDNGHKLDLRPFHTGGLGQLLDSPVCSVLWITAPGHGRCSLSPYIYKDSSLSLVPGWALVASC